jgi:hypothetical protein
MSIHSGRPAKSLTPTLDRPVRRKNAKGQLSWFGPIVADLSASGCGGGFDGTARGYGYKTIRSYMNCLNYWKMLQHRQLDLNQA